MHMYSIMRSNLDSSTLINETFLKKPGVVGEKTFAITLTKDNNFLDPSLPDGLVNCRNGCHLLAWSS